MEDINPFPYPSIKKFDDRYEALGPQPPASPARSFQAFVALAGAIPAMEYWLTIILRIKENQSRLPYPEAGITLARMGFFEPTGNNQEKLTELTLETGIQCLKALSDLTVDGNPARTAEQKEQQKQSIHIFFDHWKEKIKEDFKSAGKWMDGTNDT